MIGRLLLALVFSIVPLAADPIRVLVFTSTDCPISNRYAPEIQRLAVTFAAHVTFVLVYPVSSDSPALIREHRRKYGYTIESIRDTGLQLVEHTGVTVTPEVGSWPGSAWCTAGGLTIDTSSSAGSARSRRRMISKSLSPRPSPGRRLPRHAPGQWAAFFRSAQVTTGFWRRLCTLCTLCPILASEARAQTFTKDVAPIVFDACVTCHRQGGPGPFPLTTYDEVRRRATLIAEVTRTGFMPPWKVALDVGHFVGQRQLTAREIAIINQWAKSGTPEGDPQALPALPKFAGGWLLGRPDLIVTPDQPFSLPAQQTDAFRIFAIRLPVTKRTYVTGIEFHPGNARWFITPTSVSIARPRHGAWTTPIHCLGTTGSCHGRRNIRRATSWAGHPDKLRRSCRQNWRGRWSPAAISSCSCTCSRAARSKTYCRKSASISATARRRERRRSCASVRQGIDIPAGEAAYVIRDPYVVPVDVQLLAIQPHAHYRARELRGVAQLPDGSSRVVMHIKDSDCRWQHVYREETPIPLPKGTRLSMEYTYDNSASNVRNPELPPARVFWEQRSRDEMGDLWFQLLTSNESDRARLRSRGRRQDDR